MIDISCHILFAIKHNETKITFNKEPGFVAFRCWEVKFRREKLFPTIFIINSIQRKIEEQEKEEEMEVVEDFAPISYGGSQMIQ